ncbi:MAG: NTP transferase domain-containing protein [Thermoplasmatota archaeon]
MSPPNAVILAAGMGSRLGHDMPKALIPWGDGTILDHQLGRLRDAGMERVWVVVGFQGDKVMAQVAKGSHDGVTFVEATRYMETNTAKSLLEALAVMPPGPVVALNGDVVFDDGILQAVAADPETTALAVDPRICGEEEVKYRVRDDRLVALSKQVHGDGESVGLNHYAAADRPLLEQALAYVEDGAYFERAIEHLLPFTTRPVRCIDIGDKRAMEIDFPEDLEAARTLFDR